MKVLLRIEYPGRPFHGWQSQPGLLTVQGELERSLSIFVNSESKKAGVNVAETIQVTGSGRTDAGVAAVDQAASFCWPENLPLDRYRLVQALNGISIPELTILSAEEVADDFDARHTAHIKTYNYNFILNHSRSGFYEPTGWCIAEPLNIAAMIQAAKDIRGQHDFSSFRAQDCTAKSTVRTILSSELTRIDRYQLTYTVQGKGFLKQMVRIIAGTLVDIGHGKYPTSHISWLLTQKDRSLAGQTAPAHGLLMKRVNYDL